MADKIYLNGVIAYRQDTLENWTSINPVLERGEPSIVRDGGDGEWLKIGDGITAFNDLPYKKGPRGEKGETGPQGPQGEQGVKGETGPQGPQGEQGVKGEQGEKGPRGEKGDTGEPGKDAVTDIEYKPESENAQSGIAVAEAVSYKADKIVNSASGSNILLIDSSNYAIEGLKVYGKSTQDGTPTPEAPIPIVSAGASGSVEVKVCGGNLFTIPNRTATTRGVTLTAKNGILSATGTGTETGYATLDCNISLKKGTYYFNYNITPYMYLLDSGYQRITPNGKGVLTLTKDTTVKFIAYQVTSGITANYPNIEVSINVGSAAIPFELYKAPQTLTLATPNELRAVGSYADYIDLEKGVRVQKCKKTVFGGGEIPTDYISTTGDLTVGATVIYGLAEPIETPLTAEELAYYKALHTNYPNTTIFNSDGTNMDVSYIADTKLYIDNKFAELSAAIVNNA